MSLKKESIKLYRDILRATKAFTWKNEQGTMWKNILRENTRKEFEQARYERDPLIINRLLIVGRDCLNQTTERYSKALKDLKDKIDSTRNN
jgi:hypothetical protein